MNSTVCEYIHPLKIFTRQKSVYRMRIDTRYKIFHAVNFVTCHGPWWQKWNKWGFRPLCTYKLNWSRRISWRRWDQWDDTALQTHDSKIEPRRSEAEHTTSRSRRLATILNLYDWARKKHLVSFKLEGLRGVRARDLRLFQQAASTTTPGPRPGHGGSHNDLKSFAESLVVVRPGNSTFRCGWGLTLNPLTAGVAYMRVFIFY